jgi:hypothetical protein
MTPDASIPTTSKAMLWAGRIISAIPVLMMGVMSAVMLFAAPGKVAEGMVKYGYPAGVGRPLLIVEIVCALLYAMPQTAVLGAILLTGYLGGAVATHVRASEPFWMPLLFGVVVWLGLFLRDARIRALVPLRRDVAVEDQHGVIGAGRS